MDHVEDADLVARPIYESRYVVCCTPRTAPTLPKHPKDLDARLCLGILPEERRHPNGWRFQRDQETVELQPTGPLHFNSSDALLIAAESGIGLACVLDIFANRRLDAGTLVPVYSDWTLPIKTFYLVTQKARANSAKVRAFTDFLFEVMDSERRPSSRHAVAVKAIGHR